MKKIRGQTVYPLKERLSRLSKKNAKTGCIEWISATRNGYGRLMIGSRTDGTRKSVSAHKLAYELYRGEVPSGFEVCHNCDNPPCINPDHLFLGTRQDNIDDRENKGRNKIPKYIHDRQPNIKLTWAKVREIRSIGETALFSCREIGERYGVATKTINDVLNCRTWNPPPPATTTKEKPSD
jgi:hypothetical protein